MSAALFKKTKLKALAAAIAGMFAAPASPGIWLDNADWNTGWFQDAAGTIPVTAVEQPLGLILSKDKGLALGAELITNGDFSNGLTGWSNSSTLPATATINGAGQLELYSTSSTNALIGMSFTTVVGKEYRVLLDIPAMTANWLRVSIGTTGGGSEIFTKDFAKGTATQSIFFVATTTTTHISILNGWAGIDTIRSISCKQIAGNHVYQSTSGVRPVVSARYNLLTKTEDFSASSVWVPTNASATTDTITFSGTGTASSLDQTVTTALGSMVLSCEFYPGTSNKIQWGYIDKGVASNRAEIDWTAKTITGIAGTVTSPTLTLLSDGWYRAQFTTTVASSAGGDVFQIRGSTTTTAGQTVKARKADLRPSDQATGLLPPYQRVNTSSDYDGPDKGFPPYISFNGTQWLQTAAVDYSGVNKMLVIAGVRKLSDAAVAILVELSNNATMNSGAFYVAAPVSAAANYSTAAGGTVAPGVTATGYAAPITNVLSVIDDIPVPSLKLKVNGTQVASSAAPQGTGNFGNYAHYIGSRAGSSLFFTGQIHQLIVRGSTVAANDGQIGIGESYSRMRSRAY